MIFTEQANNIIEAAYIITMDLLEHNVPEKPVVIKPNLVEPSAPPVTTDVRVVEGILQALKKAGITEVIIAEGSGTGDTADNFRKLGYSRLGARLVDLDREKTVSLPVMNHHVWEKIMVPEILLGRFIISVPVLKEHSLCGATISLKNMVGILPETHYSGYWTYKKSNIHKYDTHGCIVDIVSVIKPDWAIVDASIGMKGHHLSGSPVTPPLNIIYGSANPLEADKFGCTLLGRQWQDIGYLHIIDSEEKRGSRA